MATYKSVASILQLVYPVGSIYTNKTVATNPATIFGFGTWVALEGRVIVGKAASGTFATAGATGGAETHTLTTPEMPAHTHDYTLTSYNDYNVNISASSSPRSLATQSTVASTSAGGGGAHNNLQPYVVAYMWERTA